jgi:hypothetical protein
LASGLLAPSVARAARPDTLGLGLRLQLRRGGSRRCGRWLPGCSALHDNAIARRQCRRDACKSQTGFRFAELLNLAVFLHGDAQMLVPVPLVLIRHIHQAGDAHPTPDPGLRRLLLQLGKPVGPNRDLDDVASRRAKIDKDVVLGRAFSDLAGPRRDFDDPPDQLDPVTDPRHRRGEVERIDDRVGRDVARRREPRGRRRLCLDLRLRRRNVASGEVFVERRDGGQRCFADRRKAARLLLQLRHRQQAPEDIAVRRVGEIVRLEDDRLAALAELRVQRFVLDDGLQAQIERNEAETVHLGTEIGNPPIWMLEVLVPGLAAVARAHAGDKHAIVIDQLDVAVGDHHVAVLNVAVGYTLKLEKARNGGKIGPRLFERARIVEALVQPDAQRITLDPIHSHDRKGLLADIDAGLLEIEIDETSVGERTQLLGNRVVLLLDRRNLPVKATHSALSTRGGDRIGQRKSSRHHERQAQIVFSDDALLQFRVDECLRRMLHRFMIFDDLRVWHLTPATTQLMWCRRASCDRPRAPPARTGRMRRAFLTGAEH